MIIVALLLVMLAKGGFTCRDEPCHLITPLQQPRYVYNPRTYQQIWTTTFNETKNNTIVCTNLHSLSEIIYKYHDQIYEQFLTIKNSSVTVVKPLELSQFTTITKLHLEHLKIQKVLPGAFNGLSRLRELYLNDNELSELSSGVYNSLHRLEILNLANNKISKIERLSLMGVANLAQLHLKNNTVSIVEDEVFKSLNHLEHVDVSQNPLKKFPFDDLSNVEYLILAETDLTDVDVDLSNLTMKVFNLSHCQLTKIDFSYFPKVDAVDLSNNKIAIVENCRSLDSVSVNLANNEITSLDGGFQSISRLYLSQNRIKVLEKSLLGGSRFLLIADFSHNQISSIDNIFFQNLSSLDSLWLQHNNIKDINPVLFRDLKSLTILDLSSNEIEQFQYGVFDSLTHLKALNISNNKLSDLHQYTFNSLSNLRRLHFDYNKIASFDVQDLRSHLSSLSTVSLDHNPWKCKEIVKIQQIFKNWQIDIVTGSTYDVENVHGIACSNPKNFAPPGIETSQISLKEVAENMQKAINDGIKNSKMERFLNEDFDNSNFADFFRKGYSQSNFFKYLDNYKFAIKQQNLNESKVAKFTALQVAPEERDNKILILSVVIQVVMSVLLLFVVYFMFAFLKKRKSSGELEASSQIELC